MGCPNCGSEKEPDCRLEMMPDGSIGAGVVYVCSDCGYEET